MALYRITEARLMRRRHSAEERAVQNGSWREAPAMLQ
jgi:hypothetical protein